MKLTKLTGFLIAAILLIVVLSLYFSSIIISNSIKKELGIYLAELTLQTAQTVKNRLVGDFQTLQAVSTFIGQDNNPNPQYYMPILGQESEKILAKRLGIVNKNGDTVTTDNLATLNLADRSYIQKAFTGKIAISSRLKDKADDLDILVLAVPIYRHNEVESVLIATFSIDILTHHISAYTFGGKGDTYIMDQSGATFASSLGAQNSHANTFEALSQDPRNATALASMRKNITEGKSGTIDYFLDNMERYANYCPIDFEGLYLLNIMPASILKAETLNRLKLIGGLSSIIILSFIILASYIHITQRKLNKSLAQSLKQLLANEQRYQSLLDNSQLPAWEVDYTRNLVTLNKYCARSLGYPPHEMTISVSHLAEILYPDEVKAQKEFLIQTVKAGLNSYDLDCRIKHQDGHWHWFKMVGNIMSVDDHGRILLMTGINLDIHDLKVAEIEGAKYTRQLEDTVIERTKELENNVAALNQHQKLLHELLESIPLGVQITINSIVRYSNQASMELFGDCNGLSEDVFYPNPEHRAYIIKELSKQHIVLNQLFPMYVPETKEIKQILISVINFKYQDEAAELSFLQDLTVMKNAELELEKARLATEKANQAKSDFLANMSHEIRTPMNGIIGLTHLALQVENSPNVRNYLEKIDLSAKSLLYLLNNILDFSKIEAGKLALEMVPFNLLSTINNVTQPIKNNAELKGLNFLVKVDLNVPTNIIGDPVCLGQILLNLLSNALKFTPQGNIYFNIQVVSLEDNYVTLNFVIRDQGIGMDPEELNAVFKIFTQADNSITRRYGGTGLGLSLTKSLVEKMQGRIDVNSEKNKGSIFTVGIRFKLNLENKTKLNTSASLTDSASPTDPKSEATFLINKHVLLAEDNDINQIVATEILEQLGVLVDIAENGEQAVALAQKNQYDLILMDIQMPIMDGYEAAKILLNQGLNAPILAMTAHAMAKDHEKSLAHGMQDHITKPIDPEILKTTLIKWLSKNNRLAPPN